MKTSTMGQGLINARRVDVGSEEYHEIEAISCSCLKRFDDDPEACYAEYIGRTAERKEKKCWTQGTRLERMILFDEAPNVILIPQDVLQVRRKANSEEVTYAKSGAPWNEWRERMIAEHGPDAALLKQEEYDSEIVPLLMAKDALMEHEAAAKLLWGASEPHVTVLATDVSTGIEMEAKCQYDIVHSLGILVDLKSAAAAHLKNIKSLMSHVLEMKYHWQCWWYKSLWLALTGEELPFIFVFVESENKACVTPKVVTLRIDYDRITVDAEGHKVTLPSEWMELAESQFRQRLSEFAACKQSGIWKPVGYGRVIDLPMPRYAVTSWEDEIRARVSK